MEKVLWVVFVFTLILVDANRQATAAETNVNATDTNNHGANFDTNKAVIVGQEKKGANLDKTSKKNENGSLNGTRDELLEEPKSTNYSGNPSLDNATDPKTLSLADFHLEGCDPSDSCINEKDMFVACLRVPGEDSLHLSLLIQNKGTKTLDVKIVAPDFVHPKDTSVILKPKLNWELSLPELLGYPSDSGATGLPGTRRSTWCCLFRLVELQKLMSWMVGITAGETVGMMRHLKHLQSLCQLHHSRALHRGNQTKMVGMIKFCISESRTQNITGFVAIFHVIFFFLPGCRKLIEY